MDPRSYHDNTIDSQFFYYYEFNDLNYIAYVYWKFNRTNGSNLFSVKYGKFSLYRFDLWFTNTHLFERILVEQIDWASNVNKNLGYVVVTNVEVNNEGIVMGNV